MSAHNTIRIKDEITGKEMEAELPNDVEMKDLLPALLSELGVKSLAKQRLKNISQDFQYDNDDTLAARGTMNQDYCSLHYESEFGGVPRAKAEKKDRVQINKIEFHIIKRDSFPQITLSMLRRDEGSLSFLVHKFFELEKECKDYRDQVMLLSSRKYTRTISAILFLLAQIVVALGINLVTKAVVVPGAWIVIAAGALIFVAGLFFSYWPTRSTNNS
jgi:hypothetical protein